jgi:hypothetical protein
MGEGMPIDHVMNTLNRGNLFILSFTLLVGMPGLLVRLIGWQKQPSQFAQA